jgi:hypothetical protein
VSKRRQKIVFRAAHFFVFDFSTKTREAREVMGFALESGGYRVCIGPVGGAFLCAPGEREKLPGRAVQVYPGQPG